MCSTQDTARILDNLLSEKNQKSWEQLERVKDYLSCHIMTTLFQTSPATSQGLVRGAEQSAKLLSKTLTNDTSEAIKAKPNIGN